MENKNITDLLWLKCKNLFATFASNPQLIASAPDERELRNDRFITLTFNL